MKIGDIDVPRSILDLEHRMMVMEQLVNFIASNNQNIKLPNQQEVEQFKETAIVTLQKKYPSMGIAKKN
jgi:hypothetical protein